MNRVSERAVSEASYASHRHAALWSELWQFRELFWSLTVREIKVKYQRSLFGLVWTLFNPIATALVLVTVFSVVVRIPVVDYWAFLLSGYFAWNFISQVVSSGTLLLEQHAGLGRSVRFPKELLVFSAVASRLVEFLVEIVLAIAIIAVLRHGQLPASVALFPLLVVLQLLLATGLALPVAALSVFYHDVRLVAPVLLMMLFYATPVFYPLEMVPESIRTLYILNPMAHLIPLYQEILYHGRMPGLTSIAAAAGFAFIVFAIGHAIFQRTRHAVAELL